MPARDITGERFGRLTAVSFEGADVRPNGRRRSVWRCRCDCGSEILARRENLISGNTQSCGCRKLDLTRARCTTHGASRTGARQKLYRVWSTMRDRCQNPNNENFKNYGARGIYVCDRWQSFENFAADVGERPSPRHSIDRVDNDGPYSPDNFRWATPLEQRRNQRRWLEQDPSRAAAATSKIP